MAYFEVDFPDDFLKKVERLANRSEETAIRMLDESSQILSDALQKEIRTKYTDTGELADSIETSEPAQNKNGDWYVWAYPAGKAKKLKKKGKTYARSKSGKATKGQALYNSDKLFYLEYGTSKQPARPLIKRVANSARNEILETMQRIYNEEVGE